MTEGVGWPPVKEDLVRLYLVEKLSAARIARVYGLRYKSPKVAESTVLYQLRKNGIKRRDPAEHIRKVTEEMVDEWTKRYQAGESLKQIAGELLNPVTVWNHLRRCRVVLRDKLEAQILAVSKYERKPFQGDKLEKAYLIGLRYGDLDAVRHGRAIRVRVSTTHPAMASLFTTLFSPYAYVRSYPRKAALTGYEWTLESDLDGSFVFLLAKPSHKELEQFGRLEFLSFLAGIFDAEGTIYLHQKRFGTGYEFCLTSIDHDLLEFIAGRLARLGYHPIIDVRRQDPLRLGYAKEGILFRLTLFRRAEVCDVLSTIRIRHQEKVLKKGLVLGPICANSANAKKSERAEWTCLVAKIRIDRNGFVELARQRLRDRGTSRGEHDYR